MGSGWVHSDRCMRCCKPDIFVLRQLAQWFWWTPQHRVRNVHQLLIVRFRCSPTSFGVQHWAYFTKFLSKSTNCIAMRYRVFLRIFQQIAPALNWCIYCLLERSIQREKHVPQLKKTIVSKNWIKQLHTLPVFHFNRCLTTEYSETTAHCNGNFDTDNLIYVP
jgi:hypothetical protein